MYLNTHGCAVADDWREAVPMASAVCRALRLLPSKTSDTHRQHTERSSYGRRAHLQATQRESSAVRIP